MPLNFLESFCWLKHSDMFWCNIWISFNSSNKRTETDYHENEALQSTIWIIESKVLKHFILFSCLEK